MIELLKAKIFSYRIKRATIKLNKTVDKLNEIIRKEQ